ncbi:hypothetical protein MANES_12G052901v8 [Manihot esculenta]|uniref:Uncharacterized protein n=1 Tax=Manihot esculenta TaxID=3983 RepID=A0ACB7GPZ1_MANES|nr:hypothetical protein MANES_12G052901v8 [Manihot esculenta]
MPSEKVDSWEPLTDFDRLWDNRSLKALLCILSQTNKKNIPLVCPRRKPPEEQILAQTPVTACEIALALVDTLIGIINHK